MSNKETTGTEWELSSGFALDGATVTVAECMFTVNTTIAADALVAQFTFLNEDDGETIEQSFSVGRGWEARDGGDRLESDTGKPRKLSERSNYGRLVGSAVQVIGSIEDMPLESPRQASGWVGTRWVMGTVETESTNPQTQEKKKGTAFVFAEYLGREEAAGKGKAGKAGQGSKDSKPAAGKAGAGSKAKDADADELDPALRKKLLKLAMAADDHDEFMESAADLIEGDEVATAAVTAKGRGSIWAEAND